MSLFWVKQPREKPVTMHSEYEGCSQGLPEGCLIGDV